MWQSNLFSKTRKEAPSDEVAKNAKLLLRGGFIHKEMAGVYSFLPLGLRVLNKTNEIIRDEMNKIGGVELFMSALQNKESWEKSGRWSDDAVDTWFKTKIKGGNEVGLGFTHEEPLTTAMKDHIRSWRDLPVYVYQIQDKFRNEERAKSGLMRTREFLMKDLYSFSRDEKEHNVFYDKIKQAYINIFNRAGIGELTYVTYASGGSFSKYSHEFQTVTEAGEDTIYVCKKCRVAVNKEILAEQSNCPVCGGKKLAEEKSVEVGNIFSLGTRFSDALGLKYIDENNESKSVVMGSYGIGPGRLIGAVVEVFGKENGLIWPDQIAPFDAHLILINVSEKSKKQAEELYEYLVKNGVEVLFDDRAGSAGEKFSDADLIGIKTRIIVSDKTAEKGIFEVKDRARDKTDFVALKDILRYFRSNS